MPPLASVGLSEPDDFWTITPEAVVTEKIAACVDVNEYDLDDEKLFPIHAARAKHLVDLVWLSRMCEAGELSNEEVFKEVEGLHRLSAPVRIERRVHLADRGFTRFKIQGRGASPAGFASVLFNEMLHDGSTLVGSEGMGDIVTPVLLL